MKFLSLEPFVPSGSNFESAKQFFLELGFAIDWDAADYVGFKREECTFILQNYDNKEFAQNFMISVRVSDINEFWKELMEKKLPQKFDIKISPITTQPYGKEVNIIDMAGVCWHFIE